MSDTEIVDTGATHGDLGGGAPPPAPPPSTDRDNQPDGPGSGRGPLRKTIERSVDDARSREQRQQRDGRPPAQRSRAREVLDGNEPEPETPDGEIQPEAQPPAQAAPASFSKEAKAEWDKTPAQVRDAIIKRETDVARGVQELKQRYADIDGAIQPRIEMIRAHGHTPAQAVNQLFSWFEALSADVQRVKNKQPPVAFSALLASFGLTPEIFGVAGGQPQPQPQTPEPETPEGLTPEQYRYIQALEQRIEQLGKGINEQFTGLANNFQLQGYQRTQETLDRWSQGKPHFEEVRGLMAHLIGSGAVPPLPNGSADLDTAYDMAVHAIPEVRAKAFAAQQAAAAEERKRKQEADRRAQQEHADKARRASGSLPTGAPGNPAQQQPGKPGQRKSVRESLAEAIAEHRN